MNKERLLALWPWLQHQNVPVDQLLVLFEYSDQHRLESWLNSIEDPA